MCVCECVCVCVCVCVCEWRGGGGGACEREDRVRKRTCGTARLIADLGGQYAHHGQIHLLRQALTSLTDNLTNNHIQFYKPAFSGERKLVTALCSPHLGPDGGWSAPARPAPRRSPTIHYFYLGTFRSAWAHLLAGDAGTRTDSFPAEKAPNGSTTT